MAAFPSLPVSVFSLCRDLSIPRSRQGPFSSLRSGAVLTGQPGVRTVWAGPGAGASILFPAPASPRSDLSSFLQLGSPPAEGVLLRRAPANQGKFEAWSLERYVYCSWLCNW